MRMLVVEDEPEVANFLKTGFEAEGFSVDSEGNGAQGSFVARTNDYDIIILDNLLPGKQGLQICREIRTSGRTVPIIILSALLETQAKINLLEVGADDYVTKPYSFGELLARVRAVMRRPERVADTVLTVGNLVLNTETKVVERGGQPISLSKKELELLEHLMSNLGKVVSRADILEHVWDMHGDPLSNTVETHILHLRKKLERPGWPKLIHTVPTRGYKVQ